VIALSRRFASLDRADRRLVIEAAFLMALVWTGLRLLPFPTLRHVLDRYAGSPRLRARAALDAKRVAKETLQIDKVRWAIAGVAARFRGLATCLVQALAARAILRRRSIACELCFGVRVRRDSATPFQAHAWVTCESRVVIGNIERLPEFTVLTVATSP
jgi:hypothetical protein